ncbi:lysophospholipid acyltransferase family protein [Mycobacterium talmoniae]|uniref:1-acyl-sn-glycerol-3-phosphate acyltransferase n=1 Tax=Mycobacterium talmoniae TaxID=1858794 RepID=A0A1S1NNN7_9MYCO|nr:MULTISPECIES: lysophospholipid acyltransferase family protein [Mycobacterium]OHV05759.1 1-acyl-sn-glycerol-3-phosphate acyltransferase [Mycobacterium talmoniae]TDH56628.1 1-acyl-sn-glycerol-3-phosphate acyltransferase [Mycobacterium eburneum]
MSPALDHPWLPRATCTTTGCVCTGADRSTPLVVAARIALAVLLVPVLPLLAVPMPGRARLQRGCCRAVLRCFGVRIAVSGGPIRNLRGVLVVSGHVSWLDVFVIGAVLPGSFVARADLLSWPALGPLARLMRIIPIERASLRRLPGVVALVAARLRAGRTVVAFPEGTTWCGRAAGRFYPAMFQAAVDAARPVQPLRLSYHHTDGSLSTLPAYVGDDTLGASMRRLIVARRTVARVHVASLQLPGADRRDLAGRCQAAVRDDRGHGHSARADAARGVVPA